jgi:hypothetical protein
VNGSSLHRDGLIKLLSVARARRSGIPDAPRALVLAPNRARPPGGQPGRRANTVVAFTRDLT